MVKNRPLTPLESVALVPSQAARKEPLPATAGDCWMQVVQALTRTGAPCAVGAAQAEVASPSAKVPAKKAAAFSIEASFLCQICDRSLLYYGADGPNVGWDLPLDPRISGCSRGNGAG